MTTKNYGAGVSAYRDADGRNFETAVYQASKPVLDSELNLAQDIDQARARSILQLAQSGWLSADVLDTSSHSSGIFLTSATANQLSMPPLKALVNGWPIVVNSTNGTSNNAVDLGAGPATGLRTDLVILEVWRRLLSASPSTVGKSQSARIWRNGNVKIASADDVALNYADDILDGAVGAETTKRVQIQYRIRVIQSVDLDGHPSGIDDPSVVAFSVPTNAATPDGTATAFTYAIQSGAGDGGLWRAGDGVPTNTLGSVDGYMYALPLSAVFRRNTTAFNRDTNHNGGSGRPDGLTAAILNARDILDLRPNISTTGWDFPELLGKNVNLILDNTLRSEQTLTPLGGGSRGHTNIWADEIGPTDNAGAQRIRAGFDGVCRRFSDRPILETVVVKFNATDQEGGGATWVNGSTLVINPTSAGAHPFRIYPYGAANFLTAAPSNVIILDVINLVAADNVSNTATIGDYEDPSTGAFATADFASIAGLGTSGPVTLKLSGSTPIAGKTSLFVTLLISYPGGAESTAGGLTKTPTSDFGASSFVLETPAQLPAGSPYLFQSLVTSFDYPHREVAIAYKTLTTSFSQRLSPGTEMSGMPFLTNYYLYVPERVATAPAPQISNLTTSDSYTGPIDISDDGRYLFVTAQDSDWTPGNAPSPGDQIQVQYQAFRPIPNNAVQFTLWYETRAPQPIRDALLGTSLTVIPRYVAPYLYTLVSGSGSADEAYPFPQQYVQSPGVYPSSGGTFSGDHELDGSGAISISDFNAETGFLQLPILIPAVPEPQSLTFVRVGGDIDAEGRSFFNAVSSGYLPSAFAQPLSDSKRHKNVLPMIAELAADGPIGAKGTLVIVLLSRWAEFDAGDFVGFESDFAANFTTASVYRMKGNPANSRRV